MEIVLLVVLALVLSGRRRPVQPAGELWVWPVPDVVTSSGVVVPAEVSQEYRDTDHTGVDIMYRNGVVGWYAPIGTPVVAVADGHVWSVERTPRGVSVVIDHGKPWATWYQHLESTTAVKGAVVKAGQQIGQMGVDPLDQQRVRHLHFAVWRDGYGDGASVDPSLLKWRRTRWTQ